MLFFFIVPSLVKESPLRFSLEIFGNIFPRSYLATVQVTKYFRVAVISTMLSSKCKYFIHSYKRCDNHYSGVLC